MIYSTETLIIKLLQLPRIGPKTAQKLIEETIGNNININSDSDLVDLVERAASRNKMIPQFSNSDFNNAFRKADVIIHESRNNNIEFVTIFEAKYPSNLRKLENPPVILNYKGNIDLFNKRCSAAVIGTREPTKHGYSLGVKIAEIFTESDCIVVSGLAKGCDTAGHVGCLNKGGTTAAILAHGLLHDVYPKENRALADKILESDGLLISEYFMFAPPRQNSFIERDRIQAGISDFVFVVETGVKGGTMHTVNYALKCKKKLYAYNHPKAYLNEEKVQGNQLLIKEKKALPIGNPEDLTMLMSTIQNMHPLTGGHNRHYQIPSIFLPPIHIDFLGEEGKKEHNPEKPKDELSN